jgi:hypothetical protein
MKKRKSKYFHSWYLSTLERRNEELFEENTHQLLYTKQQSVMKEHEYQQQYELEKERSVVLQSKINYLNRELELEKEKNALFSSEKNSRLDEETTLLNQLKAEKEKNIILNAKYNTLNNRFEKEKNEFTMKLQVLEKVVSEQQQRPRSPEPKQPQTPLFISSPPRKIYQ